jgi:hypothetical protein
MNGHLGPPQMGSIRSTVDQSCAFPGTLKNSPAAENPEAGPTRKSIESLLLKRALHGRWPQADSGMPRSAAKYPGLTKLRTKWTMRQRLGSHYWGRKSPTTKAAMTTPNHATRDSVAEIAPTINAIVTNEINMPLLEYSHSTMGRPQDGDRVGAHGYCSWRGTRPVHHDLEAGDISCASV